MQRLMNQNSARSISVSDVAQRSGHREGKYLLLFKSKEEILEAVIERSYSAAIEKAKNLLEAPDMDALTKMEIIFRTCRESSMELLRQESNNFFELQQSALLHQQYIRIMVRNLRPILSDIIRRQPRGPCTANPLRRFPRSSSLS